MPVIRTRMTAPRALAGLCRELEKMFGQNVVEIIKLVIYGSTQAMIIRDGVGWMVY